jgi:hypothetical protein
MYEHTNEVQDTKKVPSLLLSAQAPLFILIHVRHTIKDQYVRETMIMNFLKYKYRTR